MKPKIFLAVLAAATVLTSAAVAAPMIANPAMADASLVQKAQYGGADVDIFFDRRGNRVIVDRRTGDVIAVEPPRRPMRRDMRRQRQLDDSDVVVRRLPRDWEREYGRYEDPPQDYQPLPDDGSQGGYFGDENAFPEPPRSRSTEPEPKAPSKITRKPLPAPSETARAEPSTPDTIIDQPAVTTPLSSSAREDVAALQILLDRAGASPGVIDGRFGSNVDKALLGYRAITGRALKSTDTAEIKAQLQATGGPAFTTYTLTQEDVAGPFVASIPEDYSAKAKLERLSFTSIPEMLGERFHMDEKYLRALNPEANFNRVGTIIKVANVGGNAKGVVARIIADKGNKQVRVLDANGKLIAAYPATIGSSDTPSPTGIHAVSRVALNPNYTYNPKLNFKQGENDKVLTIPPGPNGPVGSVWIALDKPTYGIHGTPEPSKIGKTESHGCVRLTNWDAQELAKIVKAGVPVEFLE